MILIKITKENREPEVGEWTAIGWKVEDDWDIELNPGLKALSLSVILDAPPFSPPYTDSEKEPYNMQSYPISNSEEIFQWLHDHGKLGEEWVEWEGTFNMYKDGSVMMLPNKKCTCPAPLIRGVNHEYCGICEKDLESKTPFGQCLELLRQLADLQNGPPLETYRKEWDNTMTKIYDFLEKHEC